MTNKAKKWGFVFLGLAAIHLLFFASFESAGAIGGSVGVIIAALFGGGIVALILRFFWKKHTIYELWISSASIWFGLFLVNKILGI